MQPKPDRRRAPQYEPEMHVAGRTVETVAMVIILLLLLFGPTIAQAVDFSVKGSIEAPTAYVDGRPLSLDELDRYELMLSIAGEVVGAEDVPITGTETPLERRYEVTGGQEVCIAARVLHVDGTPSEWTEPQCKTAPGRPGTPSIIEFELRLVEPDE